MTHRRYQKPGTYCPAHPNAKNVWLFWRRCRSIINSKKRSYFSVEFIVPGLAEYAEQVVLGTHLRHPHNPTHHSTDARTH